MYRLPKNNSDAANILEDINVLRTNNDISEFEVASLFRKANELLQHDDSGQIYEALGALQCFKNNLDDCIANYERSIKISNDPPRTYHNYALSLTYFNCYYDAAEFFKIASDLDPTNTSSLDILIIAYLNSGEFFKAYNKLSEWNKKLPDQPHDFVETIFLYHNLMQKNNLSDSETSYCFKIVHRLLAKIRYFGNTLHFEIKY